MTEIINQSIKLCCEVFVFLLSAYVFLELYLMISLALLYGESFLDTSRV